MADVDSPRDITVPATAITVLSRLPSLDRLSAGKPVTSHTSALQSRTRVNEQDIGVAEDIELSEMSRPAASRSTTATSRVPLVQGPTPKQKRLLHIHFAAVCFSFFLMGWNDGATGPLLPTIQRFYKVDFAIVSLLFLSNSIGFIVGALSNIKLSDKIGFGKTFVAATIALIIGYTVQASGPPFPLFAIGYALNGWGLAIYNAQGNMYVTSMPNSAFRLGFAHASYGTGALVVPLAATQFAQMPRWQFYYLTSLGLALINCLLLILVFRFQRYEDLLGQTGQAPIEQSAASQGSIFKRMLTLKPMHTLAFWALVYTGTEVTIGGWINTYLQGLRGAGPSAGYVSSGFWGGLTIGRVAFIWFGERRVMHAYMLIAICLEITVWRIPSLLENAIAVSLVGLFLGPMYPIAMRSAGSTIPRSLLSGAIGWVAGFGQTGSALLPFLTGTLANKFGISSLQPLLVTVMAVALCLWALVPAGQERAD
ncbi:MFS general substrate transporter [Sistotremastrum niveocremeum HHB9708]|uniref:MFS general substrate transporter n=1 Tax=Sistotremastrum niveocremeum HHB9708 TaxID=1314777 RepID=A0A164S7D9_9AGAM|nr:MFS general substrate transporter [Sistotremastrum niveocremeum HHB9708]